MATPKLAHTIRRLSSDALAQSEHTRQTIELDDEVSVVMPAPVDPTDQNPRLETRYHVEDLLSRIRWSKACPLPVLLLVEDEDQISTFVDGKFHDALEIEIVATTVVQDVVTGKPIRVQSSELLNLPTRSSEAFKRVIKLVQRVWFHELLETITFDGKRIANPHNENQPK